MKPPAECLMCGGKIEPGPRVIVDRREGGTNGAGSYERIASFHERCWGTLGHVLRSQRAQKDKTAREMAEAREMSERFERLGAPS